MLKSKYWTPEELERLKQLRAEGKDINECTAILGRSKKGIEHKLYDKKEHFVFAQEPGHKLTDEEIRWFIANYPNKKNADIQRRFGISLTYVHRLAREHGLAKTVKFMKKAQEAAQVAAAESHIANGTYPPKGYHVPGGEKNCFQKGVNNEMRLGKARNKKRIEKAARSLAIRRKREKLLVDCGLPQKTNLRVVKQSQEKVDYCHGLRKCGYIQDSKDKNLFYYPLDGTRHPVRESHAEEHGIRFRSLNATYSQTKDQSKVYLDEVRLSDIITIVGKPVKKAKKVIPLASFGTNPISSRMISDLAAYSCDNSYLYDE